MMILKPFLFKTTLCLSISLISGYASSGSNESSKSIIKNETDYSEGTSLSNSTDAFQAVDLISSVQHVAKEEINRDQILLPSFEDIQSGFATVDKKISDSEDKVKTTKKEKSSSSSSTVAFG